MSVKEQLEKRLWASTTDYKEVEPYLDNPSYEVANTYKYNGLFDQYVIEIKTF